MPTYFRNNGTASCENVETLLTAAARARRSCAPATTTAWPTRSTCCAASRRCRWAPSCATAASMTARRRCARCWTRCTMTWCALGLVLTLTLHYDDLVRAPSAQQTAHLTELTPPFAVRVARLFALRAARRGRASACVPYMFAAECPSPSGKPVYSSPARKNNLKKRLERTHSTSARVA